jgi:hypothetical protein
MGLCDCTGGVDHTDKGGDDAVVSRGEARGLGVNHRERVRPVRHRPRLTSPESALRDYSTASQ